MEAPGYSVIPVVIPLGGSVSREIDLGGFDVFAVAMPAAWTAATLAFQASPFGSAEQAVVNPGGSDRPSLYQKVTDETGAEISIAAAASETIVVKSAGLQTALFPLRWVKLVSGTNAAPVAQGAARTLYLICKAYN